MKTLFLYLSLFSALFLISCSSNSSSDADDSSQPIDDPTKIQGSGNNDVLVWSEEFDVDGAPDSSTWNIQTGNGSGGWGNQEKQFYKAENIEVSNGTLKITAKKQSEGFQYTSGRMNTEDRYEFMYGKVEVRAKLPKSQGTWPAIWMLGSSFSSIGWPYCGEIDIMEQSGQDKSKVLGTCHWNGNGLYPSGDNYSPASYGTNQTVSNVDSDWHIYSVDWTINHIKIYIDDTNYFSMNTSNTQPFNDPFFILLNVAMGGTLGGVVDPAFTEDVMEIDYIRVYQ